MCVILCDRIALTVRELVVQMTREISISLFVAESCRNTLLHIVGKKVWWGPMKVWLFTPFSQSAANLLPIGLKNFRHLIFGLLGSNKNTSFSQRWLYGFCETFYYFSSFQLHVWNLYGCFVPVCRWIIQKPKLGKRFLEQYLFRKTRPDHKSTQLTLNVPIIWTSFNKF